MPRVLTMHEHRVAEAERAEYLATLVPRRVSAKSAQANFWVFEHDIEHGRFVEFTEAGDEDALVAAQAPSASGALWREVESS